MHESPINHCAHRDRVHINVNEFIGLMAVSAVKLKFSWQSREMQNQVEKSMAASRTEDEHNRRSEIKKEGNR